MAPFSAVNGANLYVDGARVARNQALTTALHYEGQWRVGGDTTSRLAVGPVQHLLQGHASPTSRSTRPRCRWRPGAAALRRQRPHGDARRPRRPTPTAPRCTPTSPTCTGGSTTRAARPSPTPRRTRRPALHEHRRDLAAVARVHRLRQVRTLRRHLERRVVAPRRSQPGRLLRGGVVQDDDHASAARSSGSAARRPATAPTTTACLHDQHRPARLRRQRGQQVHRHHARQLQRRHLAPGRGDPGQRRHAPLRRRRSRSSPTPRPLGQPTPVTGASAATRRGPAARARSSPAPSTRSRSTPVELGADSRARALQRLRRHGHQRPADRLDRHAVVHVPASARSTARTPTTPTARSPATPGTSATAPPAPGRRRATPTPRPARTRSP